MIVSNHTTDNLKVTSQHLQRQWYLQFNWIQLPYQIMKIMNQLLFIHLPLCKHLMKSHCEGHPESEDLLITMETLLHINSTCGHVPSLQKEGGGVASAKHEAQAQILDMLQN